MKRRDFLAASAAAAAGSGLVACRPPETSAASPLTSGQWGSGDYSHVPGLAGPESRRRPGAAAGGGPGNRGKDPRGEVVATESCLQGIRG